MAVVLITGGTGMIGKALCDALIQKNYQVIVLTRNPEQFSQSAGAIEYAKWDPSRGIISEDAIKRADHIIHLAGEGIADKRWTNKRKLAILESRTKSAELIIEKMKTVKNSIQTVITASAIGWYGPDPIIPNPAPFREDSPNYNDFLGNTCRQWEQSIDEAAAIGKRIVKVRTGLVLSRKGGLLDEFRKPLRFGIAPILGSGKQMMSWIHVDDLVRVYIHAIENKNINGIYNAVAPKPCSNRDLSITLARIKKGNYFIPVHVPSFILKTILGEMSIEVLKSVTVSCDKLHTEGFVFIYPSIEPALNMTEK